MASAASAPPAISVAERGDLRGRGVKGGAHVKSDSPRVHKVPMRPEIPAAHVHQGQRLRKAMNKTPKVLPSPPSCA